MTARAWHSLATLELTLREEEEEEPEEDMDLLMGARSGLGPWVEALLQARPADKPFYQDSDEDLWGRNEQQLSGLGSLLNRVEDIYEDDEEDDDDEEEAPTGAPDSYYPEWMLDVLKGDGRGSE